MHCKKVWEREFIDEQNLAAGNVAAKSDMIYEA
jgi:hypothetical protein